MKQTTKFRILMSSSSERNIDAFMKDNQDIPNLNKYTRKFQGKDKTRFYVRQVIRKGSK